MMIHFRRLCGLASLLTCVLATSFAWAQSLPETPLQKQLDHVDLGVGALGIITRSTSGPDSLLGNVVTDQPSNTVGALITLRYTKSPLVGFEFNYTYARFAQDYSGTTVNPGGVSTPLVVEVQANAHEYTGGWVFHTPKVFGLGTFASLGGGTTAFKPSKNGGEGYVEQARATYYYNVGVEQSVFSPKIGLRASFRQAFYNAPDFETNYLDNHKRTISTEPTIGVYFKF